MRHWKALTASILLVFIVLCLPASNGGGTADNKGNGTAGIKEDK